MESLGQRSLALLLACLLASITMLGISSSAPEVEVSQIPGLEDGMRIWTKGLLVDLWRYESGTESLVLAQMDDPATVKVISSQGTRPQPSEYSNLGDEILVLGELSKAGAASTVFTSSDCISVIKESEDALTIETLRSNWFLFDGDNIRIRCFLDYDDRGESLRLFSADLNTSMLATINGFDPSEFIQSMVVVGGVLTLDDRTLTLKLTVTSIARDV